MGNGNKKLTTVFGTWQWLQRGGIGSVEAKEMHTKLGPIRAVRGWTRMPTIFLGESTQKNGGCFPPGGAEAMGMLARGPVLGPLIAHVRFLQFAMPTGRSDILLQTRQQRGQCSLCGCLNGFPVSQFVAFDTRVPEYPVTLEVKVRPGFLPGFHF